MLTKQTAAFSPDENHDEIFLESLQSASSSSHVFNVASFLRCHLVLRSQLLDFTLL